MPSEEEFEARDWVKVEGLPGIFKVLSIEELEIRRKLIVMSLSDGKLHEVFVPPQKVAKVSKPLERVMMGVFDPPEKFDVLVDGLRLRYAYLYDPASVLSISKIDPLPHQIETVYKRMLSEPEPRFLLADDVGLGKTITAGMLMKELKLRERIKRILIVVPPALQYKWQKEMLERFNENFLIYGSETLEMLSKIGNPWSINDQIITSLDLAKMSPYKDWLEDTEWDLVIVDEAHKLAAHKYGNKVYYTDRFRLGELLHTRAKCFLLLTATPHSGESYAFYRLVSLVDPYLFPSEFHVNREKLSRIMIRRIKEDLGDLFPPRESETLSVEFSEEEKRLYDELTKYVGYYFNLAREAQNRGVGFAMIILQKRMASSIYAIKESLRNRLEKLSVLLKLPIEKFPELSKEDEEVLKKYLMHPEDVDEKDVEKAMRNAEALTMAKNKEELRTEIAQIEHLLNLLDSIKVDSKARFLLNFIKRLHVEAPHEKVLIFTEYRDTMEYLKELLEEDYKGQIAYIHGSMNTRDREAQADAFRKYDHIKLMVATDAAAEGIDLQHNCHIIVNYELPWNPNRIEQRIGRLHRYGQKKKVLVYNLLVKDTIEGRVFERLLQKIEVIKKEMGERVFDVLGMLLSGVKIGDLIMSIVAEGMKKFEPRIEDALRRIGERRDLIEYLERNCLIRDYIDLGFASKVQEAIAENAIRELDVERFVRKFILVNGGVLEEVNDRVYRVKLTDELKEIMLLTDGELITFSKEVAEKMGIKLITLGSKVMDRILKVVTDPAFGGWTSVKIDPKGRRGLLFVYGYSLSNVRGDLSWRRLFTLFYDLDSREVHPVNPRIIWDLEDSRFKDVRTSEEFSELLDESLEVLDEKLRALKNSFEEELKNKFGKELKIKIEDLKKYCDAKIRESYKRIERYRMKLIYDKDMEIAIRREEANIEKYKRLQEDKMRELEEKYTIVEGDYPELIAVAVVLPKIEDVQARSKVEEIERLSIEEAMKYEFSHGRRPIDVSKEFRGYDILSEGFKEKRFIEVKGFAESGDIEMTSNEWLTAERLRDSYWLYIVENSLSDEKKIRPIQNPYKNLKKLAEIKEVRDFKVVVKAKDWKALIRD
ncbi:MAG: helicase-related protein [Candidatus Bathyarchaeia archaeon]